MSVGRLDHQKVQQKAELKAGRSVARWVERKADSSV